MLSPNWLRGQFHLSEANNFRALDGNLSERSAPNKSEHVMKTNKHLVAKLPPSLPSLTLSLSSHSHTLFHIFGEIHHTARSRLPSLTADADDGRDSCTMEATRKRRCRAASTTAAHIQKVGNKNEYRILK